jgi:integrase
MTSLPNFWRVMQLQTQWRKLHPYQLPCDIDTQALKPPERSSGIVSDPISDSPHQHIISTEKAQPLLGSDNVVRVTPERGDWRSQAPANATSAEDGEFAAMQPASRLDEGLSSSLAAGETARSPEASRSPSTEGWTSDTDAEQQALFSTVRLARAMLAKKQIISMQRGDGQPSTKSQADYRRKGLLLKKAMRQVDSNALSSMKQSEVAAERYFLHQASIALGEYAANGNSFYAMRAALNWRYLRLLQKLLARQDRLQKKIKADSPLPHEEAKSASSPVRRLLDETRMRGYRILLAQTMSRLNDIAQMTRDTCQAAHLGVARQRPEAGPDTQGPSKTSKSIKSLVGRLNKHSPDWQNEFRQANNQSSKYRAQALIQSLTGIRPTEFDPHKTIPKLAKNSQSVNASPGVVITLTNKNTLRVRVPGGKVRAKAGQVERHFELQITEAIPDWFMQELQDAGGRVRLFADPDSLAKHYLRVSRRMFSHLKKSKTLHITPYCFRHVMAANLRESGWDVEEIAALLGERSADTVSHYGFRKSGGRKPKHVTSHAIVRGTVRCTNAVKPSSKVQLLTLLSRSSHSKKRR